MEDRRLFLKKSALTLMTLSMPMVLSCSKGATIRMKPNNPKKPLFSGTARPGTLKEPAA
jgi:hypothetical protein